MRSSILAASLLLFLAACEPKRPDAEPAAPPAAAGPAAPRIGTVTDWRLATLGGVPVGVGDSVAPTLKLLAGNGKAGGFGGCNRWFAGATRSGDSLSFSPIGATKMACEGPGMELEQRWFAALARVRRATEGAEELVLADSTGSPLATLRHY